MNPLEHRGHHVDECYVGEGQAFWVVVEHSDGLVGGRGSNGSPMAARVEIDLCQDRKFAWCKSEMTRVDELQADRAQVRMPR